MKSSGSGMRILEQIFPGDKKGSNVKRKLRNQVETEINLLGKSFIKVKACIKT